MQGLFDDKEFDYIETSSELPEPSDDFWSNEKWEVLGQLLRYAVPVVAIGVVLVGVFASYTYNEGADTYMQSASSETASAVLVPAEKVETAKDN
eukprot:CAMPEP_0177587004 /NCGR_PEP_ID=MMETSP0419_2-20121207/5396_1 /TAXON_ID=582737 /ORGANISM="Tetraselmis sp., Strain GSL018" /LENGTH=93 /DNA_ID=CAMNT_0019076977 /DNA_START=446 /DNA_END=727 /DNA_ORIENTATION=+